MNNTKIFAKSPWDSDDGSWDKDTKNTENIFSLNSFKKNNFSFPGGESKNFLVFLILAILGVWLLTGFYKVSPNEQGIVLRFGKHVGTTTPGLHYHLPYPIEQVLKPDVTTTQQIDIGFNEPESGLMLTGDGNIVDVKMTVQWYVKNPEDFLFNIKAPQENVRAASESAIREIMAHQQHIDSTLSEGRALIQLTVKNLIQDILDLYNSGIEITNVNLKEINPPGPVIESFRDVIRADTDHQRMLHEAESYSNNIIPRARGEAQKIIETAEGYKEAKIAKALGESERFLKLLIEYKKAPEITKKRLYLETMEHVLKNNNKMLIDQESGTHQGILPHIALPALQKETYHG